jgi:hypothetical protein
MIENNKSRVRFNREIGAIEGLTCKSVWKSKMYVFTSSVEVLEPIRLCFERFDGGILRWKSSGLLKSKTSLSAADQSEGKLNKGNQLQHCITNVKCLAQGPRLEDEIKIE